MGLSSSNEKWQRLKKRVVWPIAFDVSPKSRVISSADFRCRSALPPEAARLLQRPMLANARDDILQRPAFGHMIEHIVHGDQRDQRGVGHVLSFASLRRSSPR